ncbi:F-box/kelch-repeat protein At5g60570-like [Nymphaea colorata]|uniref:F-box/kelch-repeat protein At5g60570-like n=1 Tax=Nymphaea colorata TaxID=210225 RepID=UPI00129E2736|nr:F-box/kelch-repeat protein At5g60570-like [Nymphaea colorata]
MMTMEPSEEAKPTRSSTALIPGLPDDLALLCLARLPSRCRATAAVTSTAWKAALSPSSIDPVRRSLSLPSEAWLYLFLLSTTTTRFFFLDLLYRRLVPLLPPDIPSAYHVLPRQAASTTTHFFLLLYNTVTSSVLLFRCSGAGNPVSWTTTTVPTPHFSLPLWPTCIGLNSRLFIAGGCDFSRTTGVVGALDDGGEWHQLPSLNEPRFMAAGLVHKGKIWVVGGRKMTGSGLKMVHSGEFYQEGEWKMVPGMWPEALQSMEETMPCLVEFKGKIYALKMGTNLVVVWDDARNVWGCVGCFGEMYVEKGFKGKILSTRDELWGVKEDPFMIFRIEISGEEVGELKAYYEELKSSGRFKSLRTTRIDEEFGFDADDEYQGLLDSAFVTFS